MAALPLRSMSVVRRSLRFRRCSTATRSAHPRLWLSVHAVGVGHSEPLVKGSRLRSLEPLCPRRIHAPTQNQEALSATSEGRVAPSAVGQGSSQRAHRTLSRKKHGLNRWEDQRKTVARRHADLTRKRREFLYKLSAYYAREYARVAVEELDAKRLVEPPGNSWNCAGAPWETFLRMLEYNCERERTSSPWPPEARPKSVCHAEQRRGRRCGFGNTRVRPVGSRPTETRTLRGLSFLAVSNR